MHWTNKCPNESEMWRKNRCDRTLLDVEESDSKHSSLRSPVVRIRLLGQMTTLTQKNAQVGFSSWVLLNAKVARRNEKRNNINRQTFGSGAGVVCVSVSWRQDKVVFITSRGRSMDTCKVCWELWLQSPSQNASRIFAQMIVSYSQTFKRLNGEIRKGGIREWPLQ